MHIHAKIIDRWSTTNQFARDLNENIQTVHSWRRRGIPPRAWCRVVELMRSNGWADVSIEVLASGYAGKLPVSNTQKKRRAKPFPQEASGDHA